MPNQAGQKKKVFAPPQRIAANIVNDTSINVTWDLKYQSRYQVIGYEVLRMPGNVVTTINDPTSMATTFTGLTPGVNYTFKVRSLTSFRQSSYAQSIQSIPVGVNYNPINLGVAATSTDPRNVTVTWGVSSGGQCDYYIITNLNTGQQSAQLAGTARSTTFTGLILGTVYTFKVSGYLSSANQWYETTTPSYIAAINPTSAGTISATVIADGTARVTITPPANNGANNTGNNTYEIRHNRSSSVVATVSAGATQSVTADISGLSRGTTYNFQIVRCANQFGKVSGSSSWSNTITTWVLPYTPSLSVYDKSLAGDATGTVELKWSSYYPTWNTPTTSYIITASPSLPQGTITTAGGTSGSYTITGLNKSTSYTFQLVGVNVVGQSGMASRTATPVSVPPAPFLDNIEDPKIIVKSVGGVAYVDFKLPAVYDDGGAAVTTYQVRYYEADTGNQTMYSGQSNYPDADNLISIQNAGVLGRAYNAYLVLTNSKGTSSPSYYGQFVPANVPTIPATVNTVAASDTQLYVSWTAPAENGRPVTNTRLTITPTPTGWASNVIETGSGGTEYTISNLTPNTQYIVAVAPYNEIGWSSSARNGPWTYTYGPPLQPSAPTATVSKALNDANGDGYVEITLPAWPTSRGAGINGVEIWDNYTNTQIHATYYPWDAYAAGTKFGFRFPVRQSNQSGTFKIRYGNAYGVSPWSPNSAAVIPSSVPNAPTASATPIAVGNGAVTLYWVNGADNGAALSNHTVSYYNYTTGVTTNTAVSSGSTSTNITGLTNGVDYGFSIKHNNTFGSSAVLDLGVYNPYTTPTAPVLTTNTAVYNDTQAYVEWTATANGGRDWEQFEVTTSPATVTTVVPGGDRAVYIGSLTPNTSYSVYVRGKTAAGWSPNGSKSIGYTHGAPLMPVTPSAAGTSATLYNSYGAGAISVRVPTYPTSRGSAIDWYEVMEVRTGEIIYSYYPPTALSYQYFNRPPGYSSAYKVRFHNGYGWSDWSLATASVAAATVPGTAFTVSFTSISRTGYTISTVYTNSVSNVDATGGEPVDYNHFVRSDGGYDSGLVTASRSVTGLAPGTNYGWYVSLKNAIGEGPAIYAECATLP